ncbi:MAG: hypothetical protein L6R40_000246 [Gallowayella cf. fulva]|nr:MAG: hypothetical protein L6R40_000246 [Xanthomendoza cf. fulva]
MKNEPEGRGLPDLSVGLEQQDLSNFSLARLRLLSHFGEFEKSSRWHRGFARIAREAGYINAALRELHTSLGYDGGNIVDMEDIALCYAAQKRYAEAIKWELKALATLANGSNEERAQGLQRITQWRQETGDGEGAMQAIREAMSLVPEEIWFIYDYIMLLDRASKYEEMIDLAGKLQEMSSRSKVEDMLSVCLSLSSVEEALARAARTLGKSEFLINACQKALSAAEKTGDQERVSSTSYYLTKFRYRYERNYGSSTHLWEDLLEKLRSRGSLDWYEQMKTINALSQLYYDEAVDAEADDQAVSVPISKLEAIAKQSKAAETAGFFAQDSSSLLLGRWYFLHGNLQEARACFKLKILEAIDILTDEYPENDAYGFIVLAQVLRKAGDDLNAAAAISVGMAPIEKLKAAQKQIQGSSTKISAENNVALVESAVSDLEESAQQQPETCNRKPATAFQLSVEDNAGHPSLQEDGHHSPIEDFASLDMEAQIKNSTDESFNAGLLWSCDGECRRKAEDWQGFYICDVCYEVSFCDECLDLVKGDKLGFRMCNPSHSFWQVYPFDAKLLDVATEKVNGKVVPRATWLEKLREEWAV